MFGVEQYEFILHEIKNSVCLIGSSLQLIEKQHPQVKEFHYWNSTMSDIAKLTHMFEEFSAFRSFGDIKKENVDMGSFFRDIQNNFSTLLQGKSDYFFDIQDGLPSMEIDPLWLHNAILNLVKNASEAVGTEGQIILSAKADEKGLYIQIQDSGCGIPEESIPTIFMPMFTSKSNGTGLGLPISKLIVEAHGGSLSCSSVVGEGSVFTIFLPK